MKNSTKKTTLLVFAAGVIAAPLVYYIFRRLNRGAQPEAQEFAPAPRAKGLFSAYRGEHKPHHRKADHNGNLN